MSGFAGTLAERVTLRVRAATRDDLGGADGVWADGVTIWASVRLDGVGDQGRARFAVTVRAGVAAEKLRWGTIEMRVRRSEADPAVPDRIVWRTEAL